MTSGVLPWVAVRVHDATGDDLGMALVPCPIELGDEIAVEDHPWPLEIVDVVWGAGRGEGRGDRERAPRRTAPGLTSPGGSGPRSSWPTALWFGSKPGLRSTASIRRGVVGGSGCRRAESRFPR